MLDLNRPRMNGREFLRRVKADGDLRTIPVVVPTTSQAPDAIEAAYRDHGNAYVTKAVNLDHFTRTVRGIDRFFLGADTLPEPDAGSCPQAFGPGRQGVRCRQLRCPQDPSEEVGRTAWRRCGSTSCSATASSWSTERGNGDARRDPRSCKS
ncbi:hypothetical protein [Streptodolium elevatio]